MVVLIDGEKYNLQPDDNINAVMLFGSWARGENDSYSDMDILIVTENEKQCRYSMMGTEYEVNREWLTIYSKDSLIRMKRYSSLFLWHLKMEGIVLYKRDTFIDVLLEQLPEYTKTFEDLEQYQCICNDIEDVIQKEDFTYIYELSLLAAVIRNTCIAYCYVHGEMIFGRITPVKYVLEQKKLFSIESYQKLYRYRSEFKLTASENEKVDVSEVKEWLKKAKMLLKYVRDDYGKEGINSVYREYQV